MNPAEKRGELALRAAVIEFLDTFAEGEGKTRTLPSRRLAKEWGGISHASLTNAWSRGLSIGRKLLDVIARQKCGGSLDRLRAEAIRAWDAGLVPAEFRRRAENGMTGDAPEVKAASIVLLEEEVARLTAACATKDATISAQATELARLRGDAKQTYRRGSRVERHVSVLGELTVDPGIRSANARAQATDRRRASKK